MGRLDGKVALITGTASGIGAAAVKVFRDEGAKVVAADIADGASIAAAAGASFIRCDVTKSADCRAAVALAESAYGGLDILWSNAGIEIDKILTDTSEEEWDRVLDVNLKGTFLLCHSAIPAMLKRGGGAILATASVNGFTTEPKLAAYCASKSGQIMLMRSVAIDYGREGIRANAICPGWVDTGMTVKFLADPANRKWGDGLQPRGKVGQPEEIARVAAFIVSPEASFMTGAAVTVDGGLMSVLPGHRFD